MRSIYITLQLLLVLCLSSSLPSPISPTICASPFSVSSPIGCIKACTHPDYANCPNFYATLYFPRHCSYSKSGQWYNQTFDCQACVSGNTIGVDFNRTCSCRHFGCPAGQSCVNDKCVSNPVSPPIVTCTNVFCAPGFYCKDGQCLKLNSSCPAPSYTQIPKGCFKTCSHPDFNNCPKILGATLNTVRSSFCILTINGWRNYTSACQACSLSSIKVIAIDEQPCSCKQTGCPQNYQCQDKICVPINPCANVKCPSGTFCQDGTCKSFTPNICTNGFLLSPVGCIKSCNNPFFNNCPNVFPLLYLPSFCGYRSDGTWINFTYECQACQNNQIIAVDDQPCSCKQTGCPSNFVCQNKICVYKQPINLCANVLCPPGQYCQDGMCKLFMPPSICQNGFIFSPVGCIKSCRNPFFNNCPDVFPLLYLPSFCGYLANGTWVNYTYECQACQNNQIIAVDDQPCSCKQTGCSPGFICKDKVCIPNTPSIVVQCSKIICPFGYYCQQGKCKQIPPVIICANRQCSPGFTCISNVCVPQITCANILCSVGFTCVNAQCIRVPQLTCASIRCTSGFICDEKTLNCVPIPDPPTIITCANILCSPGYTCDKQRVTCVQIDSPVPPTITCENILCFPGYICRNAKCVRDLIIPTPSCAAVTCPVGYTCEDGRCILRDPCFGVKCPSGSFCSNGGCISTNPPNIVICNGKRCADDEFCNGNKVCYPINPQCQELAVLPATPCENPRPNERTCPTLFFFAPPESVACGRTSSGELRNYPVKCYACKDTQVTSFWSVPCNQLPFCPTGQICSNGRCIVRPNLCASKACRYGCSNEECHQCSINSHCDNDEYCQQNKCINKCALVKCIAGYKCKNGECIPKTECDVKEDCKNSWQICLQGRCVDRCQILKCAGCKFGVCGVELQNRSCKNSNDCLYSWEICRNNKCIDRCEILKCAGCKYGVCGQFGSI